MKRLIILLLVFVPPLIWSYLIYLLPIMEVCGGGNVKYFPPSCEFHIQLIGKDGGPCIFKNGDSLEGVCNLLQ